MSAVVSLGIKISASQTTVVFGTLISIGWQISGINPDSLVITTNDPAITTPTGGSGGPGGAGTWSLVPRQTVTITVTATNREYGLTASDSITITVHAPITFTATASNGPCGIYTLNWSVAGSSATTVSIDHGIGTVGLTGSASVTDLSGSITYTLTATTGVTVDTAAVAISVATHTSGSTSPTVSVDALNSAAQNFSGGTNFTAGRYFVEYVNGAWAQSQTAPTRDGSVMSSEIFAASTSLSLTTTASSGLLLVAAWSFIGATTAGSTAPTTGATGVGAFTLVNSGVGSHPSGSDYCTLEIWAARFTQKLTTASVSVTSPPGSTSWRAGSIMIADGYAAEATAKLTTFTGTNGTTSVLLQSLKAYDLMTYWGIRRLSSLGTTSTSIPPTNVIDPVINNGTTGSFNSGARMEYGSVAPPARGDQTVGWTLDDETVLDSIFIGVAVSPVPLWYLAPISITDGGANVVVIPMPAGSYASNSAATSAGAGISASYCHVGGAPIGLVLTSEDLTYVNEDTPRWTGRLVGPSPIVTLSASPSTIYAGSSSTLSYSTTATTSSIDQGIGTVSGTGTTSVSPTVTTTYTLTGTTDGFAAVTAPATVTVTTLPPPITLVATAACGSIALAWAMAAGVPYTSFNVRRSTDGITYSTIATPASLSYTDSTGTAWTTYYYQIQAVNNAVTSASSAAVNGQPQATPLTPTSPTVTGQMPTFTVTAAAAAHATSYNLYRGTASGGETLYQSGLSTPYWVDVVPGIGATSLYYQWTALNTCGESARTSEVGALPTPASCAAWEGSECPAGTTYAASESAGSTFATGSEPSATSTAWQPGGSPPSKWQP